MHIGITGTLALATTLWLGACGEDAPPVATGDNAWHFEGEKEHWGAHAGGAVEEDAGTGGGGGEAVTYYGSYSGSYSFSAEFVEYAMSDSCGGGIILDVSQYGEISTLSADPCSLSSVGLTLEFAATGSGLPDGTATGDFDETAYSLFSGPWVGTFTEGSTNTGGGSFYFTDTGDLGLMNINGSFSVSQ